MPIIQENGKIKVRWLIAHFPLDLFIRTAKAFSKELNTLCPGEFDIEIHTTSSFQTVYGKILTEKQQKALKHGQPTIKGLEEPEKTAVGKRFNKEGIQSAKTFENSGTYWGALFEALKEQKFEMSQTQVSIVGQWLDKNFHAIDLPYLFQNHDHVSKTLDGTIGSEISNRAAERTGLRAIGYTYSGGYRIIGSTDGVACLNDLAAKKFMSFTSPSRALFNFANIDNVWRANASINDIADINEEGGAIETTYLRFAGKNVLKTNHSIFMTAILTSDEFLNSLTAKQRDAFITAAHRVAKVERIWSIEDAARYENTAAEKGITIVPISAEDEARLRAAAAKVMDPQVLESLSIDPNLVNEITQLGRTLN